MTEPTEQTAEHLTLEQRRAVERSAMLRWGGLVVGLLLMDICIGMSAVVLSNMDGGHRPLRRADVTKSPEAKQTLKPFSPTTAKPSAKKASSTP